MLRILWFFLSAKNQTLSRAQISPPMAVSLWIERTYKQAGASCMRPHDWAQGNLYSSEVVVPKDPNGTR